MEQKYLKMQKNFYDVEASKWSLTEKDYVVGSYDAHQSFGDYDKYLFKDFETTGLVAIEYGCGPGRNLIRYGNRFERIDGVDISEVNIEKAKLNLGSNGIWKSKLYTCDGKSFPVDDSSYDVVFSTICLQHIACYDIRFAILKDVHRILKSGGYLCFQMGYGGRPTYADYYDNDWDASETNGGRDVGVLNEDGLKDDLLEKIGFTDYRSDILERGPGDSHSKWIWVQVKKV